MPKKSKIYVADRRRMVGSALVRRLEGDGYTRIELNLLDQQSVASFLEQEQPDYIFIATVRVGGIQANNLYRANSLHKTPLIEADLLRGGAYNRQHGRQYVSVMPMNLYGPNDNYDLTNSHMLPALLRKAKVRDDSEYVIWSSVTPQARVSVGGRPSRRLCPSDGNWV